jgi:hypothetical protein
MRSNESKCKVCLRILDRSQFGITPAGNPTGKCFKCMQDDKYEYNQRGARRSAEASRVVAEAYDRALIAQRSM